MKKAFLIGIFAFLAFIVTARAEIYTCDSCSDCTDKIASASDGDIIQLNTSISDVSGTCISFGGKDNVIFDCLGNTIDGDDSGTNYGIWLNESNSGSNNNTVRNCVVTDFYSGLYLYSSSNNTLTNITANSNSWNGLYLYHSFNNILQSITSYSNSWNGLYLYSSFNNTLQSITSYSNYWDGLFFDSSSNNTLQSITSYSNSLNGLYFDENSNYNTIQSITFYNNSGEGFYLKSSSSNTITNITSYNNSGDGLLLESSSRNNFTNITSYSNTDGFYIEYSSNNILQSITSYNNSYEGFYFDSSSNNTLQSITSYSNYDGINFYSSSSNTISNSRIEGNTNYGIYMDDSSCNNNNLFYNNYINNTNNMYLVSCADNMWNTTKTLRTNIIGGQYIAGNYWTNPSGTGFSDTCEDGNGDGICDSSYTLDANNIDYLPLTYETTPPDISWNTPANNSFTNNQSSILWNVTISETPSECILQINGTANYSMLISGNDCYYTTASLANQTTYCGVVYANDSAGNMNVSATQCATINLTEYIPPTPPTPTPSGRISETVPAPFNIIAGLTLGAGFIFLILNTLFAGALDGTLTTRKLIFAGIAILIMAFLLSAVF